MEQELIQFILQNGIRDVLTQEETPGNLFRPLTISYTLDNQVVIETITYVKGADSPEWGSESSRQYTIQTESGFNSIEI